MKDIKENLTRILGKDAIFDDPGKIMEYSMDKSFARPMKPVMVVSPKSVDQVQELVKWANETNTPLVPVSSKGPHFRGDTVPSVPEAVVVDLSGMNKILNINRQHRMAIVEPGVTYGELQTALAKEGMTLATSIAPRATKSVLASVLEVEPRLNSLHQWSYQDPLRCMEVVWGDGVKMFTGDAAGGVRDLSKQWAAEKWQVGSTGPMMFDFYRVLTSAQGSMGIVTWASVKCELMPSIHKLYFVPSEKSEDLEDFVYRVIRLRFSDELFIVNSSYLATLLGETPEAVRELRDLLPRWAALIGIAGRELLPEERVAAHEKSIAEIAQQYGQKLVNALPGAKAEAVLDKIINPSKEKYWKETLKGSFQEVFFVTTLDQTGRFIETVNKAAIHEGYPTQDIGVYIQPQHCGTSCHLEFLFPYDSSNPIEEKRMRKLFTRASEECSRQGAYFARPYGLWSKLQLNKDAQSYMTLQKIKGIFDPKAVMNPGKLSV